MRIYIAGPMRGLPEWNFPAFDMAEARWRQAGHIAFSPAATDRALGYSAVNGDASPEHLKHVMLSAIACLYNADAIALLPGWERSSGATVELALALFLGLKVYDAVTMDRLENIERHPWQKVRTLLGEEQASCT